MCYRGKEEWKCDNDAEKKPTKACCTPVLSENNQLSLKENTNFFSSPRPYVDPLKKSWWQWTKDCVYNGWQKTKSIFTFKSTRGESSTIVKWLKFIPIQLWRGMKWIFHALLGILVWILDAFMQIFRGREASKTEDETPKHYVYKKIESPRDYLNYDSTFDEPAFEEKFEAKKDEKTAEGISVEDVKDEITLNNIQKAPEQSIISSPQVAPAAFSHEQFTEPESHANQESPISFYARRVSVASSKSGEHGARFTSPPPPAPPPPPKISIRIPTTTNTENTTTSQKTTHEKAQDASIKGGVSVMVPGLMDAAKESIERRRRGRTLSPDTSETKNASNNEIWAPYRSPSVFGTTPVATTATTIQNRFNTTTSSSNQGVVTRMNAETPTSEAFLFRPRSQTARNIETTHHKTEDYFHPDNQHYQQQKRMFSTSPTPSALLLGQSVFKPVIEVEKIRDNFNRKCESRAASVIGGGYSRSPSVMSQSYHDGVRDYDNYTPYRFVIKIFYSESEMQSFRDSANESNALRHRFPMHSTVASNNDYSTTSYPHPPSHKWTIRNNGKEDDVFSRLPIGGMRSKENTMYTRGIKNQIKKTNKKGDKTRMYVIYSIKKLLSEKS